LQAQQESQYTQFMYNKTLLNASYAGARRVHSIYAIYRNQWMGFNGRPQSYLLSYDGPINGNRLGGSMIIANQEMGIVKNQFANAAISYDIINTEQMSLRLGINVVARRYSFDINNQDIFVQDFQDASLNKGDARTKYYANVGTGAYFDFKHLYFGVSVPNLNKNLIALGENANSTSPAQEQRHFYMMTGGFIPLKKDIHFKPSLLLKYVKYAPMSADLNLSLVFKQRFSGGISYRYGQSGGKGDSFDFLTFFQATDKLGIGLAYDYTLSKIKKYSSGSIEALLRYDFTKTTKSTNKKNVSEKQGSLLSNPRFFF
jgi:type IX secretion system PorP/SprF family membrane protein